jgi:DNA-binding NarL/FixJ family response regulator
VPNKPRRPRKTAARKTTTGKGHTGGKTTAQRTTAPKKAAARKTVGRRTTRGFTVREQQVLMAVAEGYPNREIAKRLKVSEKQVRDYMKRLLSKLNRELLEGG